MGSGTDESTDTDGEADASTGGSSDDAMEIGSSGTTDLGATRTPADACGAAPRWIR
ncbi:MAG: hypothetical protein AAF799_13390 [Myxococcota bacterium]